MYQMTAIDLQQKLIRMMGGEADPDSVSDIRAAIRQAMRIVSAEHAWPYYQDYLHLLTEDAETTGTITYVASTRTVTLAGGTWPSWAAQGVVIIDTYHARVDTVSSSTVLTVLSDDAPSANYSGTFTIYQYQYTLPTNENIYKVGKIQIDQSNWLDFVAPSLFETDVRRQYLSTGGRPRWFTISRDRKNTGQRLLSLWPYPTTVLRCRMGYIRHPRDIRTWEVNAGQVSTTASSTTVTGTGTAFTATHEGCMLRTYSDRINVPTSLDGLYPPVDEVVIDDVASATSLTTKSALTTTSAEPVAFSISDIIDADNSAMLEAITYAARRELARLRRVDPKLQAAYEADYQSALYIAKTQASTSQAVKVAGSFRTSNVGWPGLWDSAYILS